MDNDTTRDGAVTEETVAEETVTEETVAEETVAEETVAEDVAADESPDAAPEEEKAQAAPRKKFGARQIFLFGMLLALVALWVASAVDLYLMKGAVTQVAKAEIEEILADYNITGSEDDRYRIATVVTPTRKYAGFEESYPPDPNVEILNTLSLGFLFGEPSAKLTVYVQDREFDENGGPESQGSHGHRAAEIVGYDYYYVIRNEKWFNNENSRCSAPDCQKYGTIAFDKLDRKKK